MEFAHSITSIFIKHYLALFYLYIIKYFFMLKDDVVRENIFLPA